MVGLATGSLYQRPRSHATRPPSRGPVPCDPTASPTPHLTRDARVAVVGQGYSSLAGLRGRRGRGSRSPASTSTRPGWPRWPRRAERPRGRRGAFQRGVATGGSPSPPRPGPWRGRRGLICVPTPVPHHTPTSPTSSSLPRRGEHLTGGRLVVLESTTYPGTTNEWSPPAEASGQRVGRDFLLAYSPERIDPGNQEFHFANTPRIVGAPPPRRPRWRPCSTSR